jgi:hypothetical protein
MGGTEGVGGGISRLSTGGIFREEEEQSESGDNMVSKDVTYAFSLY